MKLQNKKWEKEQLTINNKKEIIYNGQKIKITNNVYDKHIISITMIKYFIYETYVVNI